MTEYNIRLNPNCASVVHTGLKFKSGDKGIKFVIAVDELDTTGTTAKIVFLRANGTSVESDITGTDGAYTYKTLGNEFAVPGKTIADVKFYTSEGRVSTASFVFEVCGDTLAGLGVGTGGYSDQLEKLVSDAERMAAEMDKSLQEFKEQFGEEGALTPRGKWTDDVTYELRDIVYHSECIWIALTENVGIEPSEENAAVWMLGATGGGASLEEIQNIINGTTPVAKATDADTVDGLHANEIADGTNLLINPDFKNPVNTSGNTSWTIGTTAKAVFDTWYGARGIFDLSSDGIRITMDGTNLNPFIQNRISKGNLAGKEVTFSAEVDGVVYSVNLTVPTTVSASDYSEHFENGLHFGVGLTSTQVWCTILNDGSAEQFTVAWAKLEIGKQATPFVPPNAEVEKLKCGKADYLPLTGGILSDHLAIKKSTYPTLKIMNTTTGRQTNIQAGDSNTAGVNNDKDNDNHVRFYLFSETTSLESIARLRVAKEGVTNYYNMLHTGNSKKVVESASAPSDTTAIWIDTTNKKVKAYIDGAWTALA